MNRPQLLQHFDTLAETPDAVEKLRAFVLDLAVCGKIVEQKPGGLSAKECIRKANKPLADLKFDDSFGGPKGWIRLPLGCLIASNIGGGTPSKQNSNYWNGPIPWASVKDIQSGKYLTSTIDTITKEGLKDSSSNLIPPNRLIVVTRMGLGKLAINKIPVAINQDLRAIEPTSALDMDFAYLLFKSLKMVGSGVTVKGITVEKLHAMSVLLPPLAEQRRIVAKVEELLALCDELEARQTAAREHRTRLVRSALDHLTTAQTELEFRQHAAFVLQHSDLVLDSVSTLRQSIFSLAVQGKLLPQNAKQDGTAAQGLNDRHRRLKSNGTTQKKSLLEFQAVDDASIPMPLPENWKWIRFGEVADRLEYGTSEKSFANENGVPTLRMGNVQDGKLDFGNLKYVPYECADLPKLFLDDGDIVFNRTNSAELVGKAAVFRGKPKCFTLASYLIRVSLDESVASPDFFNLAINSSYYRRTQIEPELTQQCGQANFSGSKLANSLVPLPPLAEQHRIVAKVDELMRWCDALEARLTAAQTSATALLDATLHQILAA